MKRTRHEATACARCAARRKFPQDGTHKNEQASVGVVVAADALAWACLRSGRSSYRHGYLQSREDLSKNGMGERIFRRIRVGSNTTSRVRGRYTKRHAVQRWENHVDRHGALLVRFHRRIRRRVTPRWRVESREHESSKVVDRLSVVQSSSADFFLSAIHELTLVMLSVSCILPFSSVDTKNDGD